MNVKAIKTNFTELDNVIGGFFPGELTVIGSRPSIGKSAFLGTLINKITIENGAKGLFFSLEMPAAQFKDRLVSSISCIPYSKIRNSEMDKDELKNYKTVLAEVSDLPIIIEDGVDNINDICDMARTKVKENAIDIIYIDYLGLITINDNAAPVYEKVTEIIIKLKKLAKELQIPILITCQVARSCDNLAPNLQQLRGSGALEDVSDIVLFVHRENVEDSVATLIVAKNHYGETAEFKLNFSREIVRFESPVIYYCSDTNSSK